MRYRIIKSASCFLLTLFFFPAVFAQLGKITVDLEKDKPTKFKTRTLKSEKTGEKKFTFPKRVVQNTASHYNYFFNANNKITEVIEKARLSNNDIYYKLLPFYSYSLTNTASQSVELDSVIYKATAGILLHDLRSQWVDNFYLLIGKAYLLKRDFDSAAMTFQFINYNLYPKKKKDEDQVIVGSNLNGANSVSIANKETTKFLPKTFLRPPSRNDALVWQIRTLIETEELSDAAGLINTLRNDPNFPARLKPSLEEVNAYWFYKQDIFDSAAAHLELALSNATDLQEKARSEYLLAQLYELTKNRIKASEYYHKAIKHTTDPLLDIYANLSDAKMYDSSSLNEIDKSIATLKRMAKRDKFETYRDIIYYSAGELALVKPDTAEAELFLKKSLTYDESSSSVKNKTFLKLADINFIRKIYKNAFAFYDSLQLSDTLIGDVALIEQRKSALSGIVEKINIIEREDSLQKIALMTPVAREAFIKNLSKKLRKERGIKGDDFSNTSASSAFDTKNVSGDIFSSNTSEGDWYFYNAAVKSRGYSEFKSRWGKRQNVDNWRRKGGSETLKGNNKLDNKQATSTNVDPSAVNKSDNIPQGIDVSGDVDAISLIKSVGIDPSTLTNSDAVADLSYEGMLENVPTTDEKLKASNALVSRALFQLAKLYQNTLEDYGSAIETYEKSLQRYPDSLYGGELYMNLAYCYQKVGDVAKYNYYKNILNNKFANSNFSKLINNPKEALAATKNPEATKEYESIYNLFIEGKFEEALQQKKIADSLHANNYWTPQLLYIESVYYLKQRDDSNALRVLNDIVSSYPTSPLKSKAERMIDVVERRGQIEGYLSKLKIERAKEDEPIVITETPVYKPADSVRNTVIIKKQDSIPNPVKNNKPVVINGSFNINPAAPQLVAMLLDKVDPVYISEARNAFNRYNHDNFSRDNIQISKEVIDQEKSTLIFTQFPDAAAAATYAGKIKKDAAIEVSWLPANKYSFFIISEDNLQLLKLNKDLQGYLKVLHNTMPDKF